VANKVVYIVNAQGERIPISISTAALKDARGKTIGGVESFRDLRLVNKLRREAAFLSKTISRKLLPAVSSEISESPIRKSALILPFQKSELLIRKFTVEEWAQAFPLSWTHHVHHHPPNTPNRNAITSDNLLLHLQQKVVLGQWRLNVRNCRPASRSTFTRRRHACCPR
jgi:hypothetical protein